MLPTDDDDVVDDLGKQQLPQGDVHTQQLCRALLVVGAAWYPVAYGDGVQ
jgi:hypothetical protein